MDKFPDGESVDDLATRAEQAINELLMPHVWETAKSGRTGVHIAMVSHGLCISELIAALVRKDARGGEKTANRYKGLMNTAWTKATIDIQGVKEGKAEFSDSNPPPLQIKVTDVNRHEHIDNIVRQKGIGSAAHDPKQQDIRAFFGGASVEAQEHAESNAHDETELEPKL